MVNLLLSLFTPQAGMDAAGAGILSSNVAAQGDGALAKSPLFDALITQQVSQQIAPQAIKMAANGNVPVVQADGFPVDPALEAEWLQTTGAEVVAGVPESVDAIDASEIAMISVMPPVQMQEEVAQSPRELALLAGDGLGVEAALPVVADSAEFVVGSQSASLAGAEQSYDVAVTQESSVALQDQAVNAVVKKAKKATHKTADDGAEKTALQAASLIEQAAQADAPAVGQTALQASLANAPASLQQQTQKMLRMAHENAQNIVESSQDAGALFASDVAAQQLGVQSTILASGGDKALASDVASGQAAVLVKAAIPANETAVSAGAASVPTHNPFATRRDAKTDGVDAKNDVSQLVAEGRAPVSLGEVQAVRNVQKEASFEDMLSVNMGASESADAELADVGGAVSSSGSDTLFGIGGDVQKLQSPREASALSHVHLQRGVSAHASVHEQIQVQVQQSVQNGGVDTIRIELNPIELGSIKVSLEVAADNSTQVVVTAERQETLDMLQRDAKGLAKALEDAGLQADAGSLQFNMSGDGRSGGEAQAQKDSSGMDFESNTSSNAELEKVASEVIQQDAVETTNYTVSVQQGLDISV